MLPYGRQSISTGDVEAVTAVLRGDWLTTGPTVTAFEQEISRVCGGHPSVTCTSGTAALHTAYAALGLGPGDEVVTTPMTFVATANAVVYMGAEPRFADVDPGTLLIDPGNVASAVTPRTRALLPV
ncbi:MAG: DegT/DnrJ/EryC1/StrS family aminotransferase, partial [Nocardioidaceae bacterium]